MAKNSRFHYRLVFLNWVVMAAIFAGDLIVPLGVAGAVLYVFVVLIAAFVSQRQVILFAGYSTLLTLIGLLVSPHEPILSAVLNRLLGVLSIWIVAALGLRLRQRTADVLRQARILDEVREGILVMDAVGRIEFCNIAATDIFGYAESDLVDRSMSTLFMTEPDVDLITLLQARPLSEGPYRLNYNGRRSNGDLFAAREWVLHRFDDLGQPAGFVLGVTEETADLLLEEAVHQVEDFYRDLLDKLPFQVALFDADGRFLYLNPASLTSPEMRRWILGKTEREYFERVQRNVSLASTREAYFRQCVSKKTSVVFEEAFLSGSDELRHFLHGFSPVLESDSEISKVVGYRYDVTDLKIAERNLAESHARLHAIVDTAGEGIITIDQSGIVESANQVAQSLLGYPANEIAGLHVNCLLSPFVEDDACWHPVAPPDIEWLTASAETREVCSRRKNYETFPAELTVSDLPLPPRHLYTVILRDITDRKRSEQKLRRYNDRLQGLRRIDQSILTAQSPKDIGEVAASHLMKMVPARSVRVVVFEHAKDSADELVIMEDGSVTEETLTADRYREELARFEAHSERLGPTVENGAEVAAADTKSYEELRIDLPLRVHHLPIGILGLEGNSADGFSKSDLEIAREVAGPLAVALQDAQLFEEVEQSRERLRALSRRLVKIQEDERRRLARELHDEVGQTLTGLKLLLETAALQSRSSPTAPLDEAKEVVRQLLGRVRNLSLDLRPAMLDDLGLVPALLWLVDRYERQTLIKVDFRHEMADGLAPEVETAVYRIVQEALTNVVKHSRAKSATVLLRSADDSFIVTVRDSGIGFDLQATLRNRPSTGLSGIQERIELLEGSFIVESSPGGGTCLTAILPRNGSKT